MREEEAKTKWCPMFRIIDIENGVGNMPHQSPHDSNCIASGCMAWVVTDQVYDRETELWSKSKNCKVTSAYSDDADWRPVGEDADKEPPPPCGHCGLSK